ncbi:MAG: hypothetical protein ABIS67_00890 [Candidatus Eisenbacteria bacterium]
MYPRHTASEGSTSGGPNRRAFKKLVDSGMPPGLLAYDGDEPVGWVAIASRAASIVEGCPVDTRGKTYAPTFAFHGVVATFASAGFHEVLRRSERRPIMRRALNPARKPGRRG